MKEMKFKFNGEDISIKSNRNSFVLQYPCSSLQVCFPFETTLPSGLFLLEVWGSQGGSDKTVEGGLGGYSRGLLNLQFPTKAFFYVGARGNYTIGPSSYSLPSFNGGGIGRNDVVRLIGTSGGGGSDIRLLSDDLYHRVIVAGGGGGSSDSYNRCVGGFGGGYIGGTGERCHESYPSGTGGTQTAGGVTSSDGSNGIFGFGGNKTGHDGCGGGGGWYGGGAGNGYMNSGGGGSGFVFTKENEEISNLHNLELPSNFFLEDAVTLGGSESFYSPVGLTNETGHSGNGIIIITPVTHFCTPTNICSIYSFFHRYHLNILSQYLY